MPVNPEDLLPPGWQDWPVEQKEYALQRIKYEWRFWAREEQLAPLTEWDIWLILAGRGFGKTRTGAEWIKDKLQTNPGYRAGIIAPSYSAARDVCLEGESGLLKVIPETDIVKYNRSLGQVRLKNGSMVQIYSGNDPEKLRGPQHHYLWIDELCAFQYPQDTWDMAMFGLRLGVHPQTLVSTTPKPIPLIKRLVSRFTSGDPRVALSKGSTYDNAANLAESALRAFVEEYEGTHLGRQELYAELISDAPGALWTRDLLEETRTKKVEDVPAMSRIVVAIDPAVSVGKRSDSTGIIVAGKGMDRKGYVIEDLTMKRASPDVWAKRAIDAFRIHKADRIVAEANNGGDMVEKTLRTIDPNVPIKLVYASRGKLIRAEPVSALYEQKRCRHVGMFAELEDELCSWVPGEKQPSPNRLDALVWAFTELMLGGGMSEVFVAGTEAGPVPSASGAVWSRGEGGPAAPPRGGRPAYADRFAQGSGSLGWSRSG